MINQSDIEYTHGAKDVHRREQGYFTAEEMIRNFFGLYSQSKIDANGQSFYTDDLQSEEKIRKAGVYDYLTTHQEALGKLGITEAHMKQLFPYVQFNKVTSTADGKVESESGLPTLSNDSGEPKKRGRKASVPQS